MIPLTAVQVTSDSYFSDRIYCPQITQITQIFFDLFISLTVIPDLIRDPFLNVR